MTEIICFVKVKFNDIYYWGKGYKDSETLLRWKTYWKTAKGYYWNYVEIPDGYSNTEYLVSVPGSIYLHPMDFNCVLKGCGVMCNGSYFGSELNELYKLCKGAAEACGGTFTMEVSEEKEIDTNLKPFNAE